MMDSETKHIHIADYNYLLPSERIAKSVSYTHLTLPTT